MRGRIKTQVHASVSCKWIAGEPRQEAGRRTGNAARTHPTTDGKNFMKQEMIATSFQQIHSFNWAWPLKSKPPTKACSVFLLKGLSWQMERRSKSSKIKKLSTEPRQGSHQWLSYPDLGSNHPDHSTERMSDSWSVPRFGYRILLACSVCKEKKKEITTLFIKELRIQQDRINHSVKKSGEKHPSCKSTSVGDPFI